MAFYQQPLRQQLQASKESRILWAGQPPGLLPQWPTKAPSQLLPWPWHPCYSQARPIQSLMMTEDTKKRSRATHLHCPLVAVCGSVQRGHQVMLGSGTVNPQPWPLRSHWRVRQRRCLTPPLVPSLLLSGLMAGGAGVRKGRGMGRRQQITSETQRVFLPKGLNAVWWVSVSAEIYRTLHARNTSRPCSWHVACSWTRPGAVSLSVVSLHVPSQRQLVPLAMQKGKAKEGLAGGRK